MSSEHRLLTKSLFKLALECPRKLDYASKPHEYFDSSSQDTFLAKLAEGGYQVGELAKLMFHDGIDLSQLDQKEQLRLTHELLQRDSVVIFEAAIQSKGLFARVDILRKQGCSVEIMEVKAKAFDPLQDAVFRGKKGGFRAEVLPYLQDVAFQRHVFDLAFPHLKSTCSLLFADKTARASVTGINQMFPVGVMGGRIKVIPQAGVTAQSLGSPLLTRVPLDSIVDEVLDSDVDMGPTGVLPLRAAIPIIAEARNKDQSLPPKISACCRKCQFKVAGDAAGPKRSGFHRCWREQTGLANEQLEQPLVLDLWNSRRVSRFVRDGQYLMSQLTADDLGHDGSMPGDDGITLAQLHWFQASKKWPGGGEFYLHPGLKRVMASWRFPLHFIDFETATVAIPFHAGSRPYETVAFQFSHHVLLADGTARHQDQFLHVEPGENPNFHFLRALRQALSRDDGTVFRWHSHENTVLNQIIDMLEEQRGSIPDGDELIAFALTLVERESAGERCIGARAMVDLCALSQKFFFHPSTNGSPSLKKVLPALMQCSPELKRVYSQPVYGKGQIIGSLNFERPTAWWQETDGRVSDPYKLLPPIADNAEPDSVLQSLRDGGAAMTAYVRLQFESVSASEREAVTNGLLRYCELDTLAMLMAVQAWRAWCAEPN